MKDILEQYTFLEETSKGKAPKKPFWNWVITFIILSVLAALFFIST